MKTLISHSEAETRRIARALSATLTAGSVVLISGDLGAGKTAFVKGLAEGLGVDADEVTSPTFTLVHEYHGGRLPLLHVDLYRVEHADLDEIGLDRDLAVHGITAVEWPERLTAIPAPTIRIRLRDRGGSTRTIDVG